MMQGDQYKLPIEVTANGEPVDFSEFEDVEVQFGPIYKSKKNGNITYDRANKEMLVSVSESDTSYLPPKHYQVRIRFSYPCGDKVGYIAGAVAVLNSSFGRAKYEN